MTAAITTRPARKSDAAEIALLVNIAVHREIPLVVIGPDESPFTRAAYGAPRGLVLKGTAGEWVPVLTRALGAP